MIKKLLSIPALSALLILAVPVPAFAQGAIDPSVCRDNPEATLCKEAKATKNQDEDTNSIVGRDGILAKVANLLLVVTGVIAVIMIIVGGIQYTISAGDSQRVGKAKNVIIYAIVGMVIALASRQIIIFVVSRL
jgi:hypothetical protein